MDVPFKAYDRSEWFKAPGRNNVSIMIIRPEDDCLTQPSMGAHTKIGQLLASTSINLSSRE